MRSPIIDRVFQLTLLGMVLSGFLSVVFGGNLPAILQLLVTLALVLRGMALSGLKIAPRFENLISDRWLAIGVLTSFVAFAADMLWFSRDFVDSTIHLLFVAVFLKLLSIRTERDFLYLRILAFLEIMAGAMISAHAAFSFFLFAFLLCGMANFAAGEIRSAAGQSRQVSREALPFFAGRLLKLTTGVSFGVVLVTVFLFFVLPRTTRAALQAWVDPRYHFTGFSNSVTLGQIGEIRMKREPVMHVRLDTPNRPATLRWRGAALSKFTGRLWTANFKGRRYTTSREMTTVVDPDQRRRPGRRITFEVQLRPTGSETIFVPGIPEHIQIDTPSFYQNSSGSLFSSYLGGRVARYFVNSYMEEPSAPGAPPSAVDREELLHYPGSLDPRIEGLAHDWVSGAGGNPKQKALALTQHLRSAYKYSTQLLDREVPDPLAHFLFDRGKGHCEYFASALAVMLRAEKIPSRVVTGFLGGDYNPISGWYVVRASDAHSWVEAYIEGEGWITLDPTPPADGRTSSFTWIARFNDFFDALETFWQDWVLSYNLEQQVTLVVKTEQAGASTFARWATDAQTFLSSIWQSTRRLGLAVMLVVAVLTILALLGPAFVPHLARWWMRRQQRKRMLDGRVTARDATLIYRRMLDVLAGRGFEKPAWVTPREFAGMVESTPEGAAVRELTEAYHAVRFGGDASGARRMVELLGAIESART
jgi:transglutaminase-like putative cysteine protease